MQPGTKFKKYDIRDLNLADIEKIMLDNGEKAFRAKQIYEWLWQKAASSFDTMTNLSKPLREFLNINFVIHGLQIDSVQESKDGTRKYAFRLYDDKLIESVLIPSKDRVTACISSQVGCNFGCKFCATGKLRFKRNLTVGEIFDQVALLQKEAETKYDNTLSNIVIMGMGAPLLNFTNTRRAIERLTSENGLGISPRRITLSTVGIPKKIKRLADEDVKFHLAISLHTANNHKRSHIMPVNNSYPLEKLQNSIAYFHKKTNSRITFEYLLMRDFNDSLTDAAELANFCKIVPCKVNLIEFNPVEGCEFKRSDREKTEAFFNFLQNKNIIVNIRRSKGSDIDAACGQLANKKMNDD